MSPLHQFVWGLTGSVAILVVAVNRSLSRRARLPLHYRLPSYWANRGALMLVAGLVAVAFDVSTPLQAMWVGATAPLVVEAWMHRSHSSPSAQAAGGGGLDRRGTSLQDDTALHRGSDKCVRSRQSAS